MCNFFEYYFFKLNFDLNFQSEVIKAIITGLVAFLSALFVFGIGKLIEWNKEKKRLKNVRLSLYYNLKSLRKACLSQIQHLQNIIEEINDNKKKSVSGEQSGQPLTEIELKELESQIFKRKSLLTPLTINYGINPTQINKISNEDFYKIFIHSHREITNKEIEIVQKFLVNTDILLGTIPKLKEMQIKLADEYNKNKHQIKKYLYTVNTLIDKKKHEFIIKFKENNFQPITDELYYKELIELYSAFAKNNYQRISTIETVMQYLDDISKINKLHTGNKIVALILAEIAINIQLSFDIYKEIYVTQFAHLKDLESTKKNLEDIGQNTLLLLEQEFVEFKGDFNK